MNLTKRQKPNLLSDKTHSLIYSLRYKLDSVLKESPTFLPANKSEQQNSKYHSFMYENNKSSNYSKVSNTST